MSKRNLNYYFTTCTLTNLRALMSTLRLIMILYVWSNKEERQGSYFFILFILQGNHRCSTTKERELESHPSLGLKLMAI